MEKSRIAIIGGTGSLGSGLAIRCAAAGHSVIIGTRDVTRGKEFAATLEATLAQRGKKVEIGVASYEDAAKAGDILILTVKFAHSMDALNAIRTHAQGKILVDTTVPLVPPKVMRVQLPPEGSAAQITQQVLGEGVKVVSAFQNVAAQHLHEDGEVPCDIIVTGDDREARSTVIAIAESTGMRALHGGPLCNAAAAEALTSVLIFMNKEYSAHSGIRLTGI